MSYSNGLITAPVVLAQNTGDIERALGITSGDLGTVCASTNVNKWSKYKPIKYNKISKLLAADWVAANYGIIDIPTWTRLDYMADFLFYPSDRPSQTNKWPECDIEKGSLSLEYWAHNRPTGGSSSQYRQTDSENYYHLAEEPIQALPSTTIHISPEAVLQIMFPRGVIVNGLTLLLSDLTWPGSNNYSIANMYFGVLMKKTGSGNTIYASLMMNGSTYVKMGDVTGNYYVVEIQLTASQASFAGTWNILPIISSVTFPQLTTSLSTYNSNKFLAPLPFHNQNITIDIEYAEIIIVSAIGGRYIDGQNKYVYITLNLANYGSESRRFRADVYLYDNNGNRTCPSGASYDGTTGSKLLAANTSDTYLIKVLVTPDWNYFSSGSFTVTTTIDATYDPAVFKRQNTLPMVAMHDITPTPNA